MHWHFQLGRSFQKNISPIPQLDCLIGECCAFCCSIIETLGLKWRQEHLSNRDKSNHVLTKTLQDIAFAEHRSSRWIEGLVYSDVCLLLLLSIRRALKNFSECVDASDGPGSKFVFPQGWYQVVEAKRRNLCFFEFLLPGIHAGNGAWFVKEMHDADMFVHSCHRLYIWHHVCNSAEMLRAMASPFTGTISHVSPAPAHWVSFCSYLKRSALSRWFRWYIFEFRLIV